MIKNILPTCALSLAAFLVIQVSDVKATRFTYSEENDEDSPVKTVRIWNQAGNMFAIGIASPESKVVPTKKVPLVISKWCNDIDFIANHENCKALDKPPTYSWILSFTLELENGKSIFVGDDQRIVVHSEQKNVHIVRTGPTTATATVE